jgi:hypothetical protein
MKKSAFFEKSPTFFQVNCKKISWWFIHPASNDNIGVLLQGRTRQIMSSPDEITVSAAKICW